MKQTVYTIKDANGDTDRVFVINGDLDANHVIQLVKRLSKIGYYLDADSAAGDGSDLVKRIYDLEKLVKEQA